MGDGLTAGEMLKDAIARTGISEVGDDWFLGPLTAWATDLQQANLSERGRRILRSMAVRDLARRLHVLAVLREHPEINDVELPPIVYITGLERSGTTLLHNLLALHDGARSLLRWELMEPVPPPTTATYHSDPRIAAAQAAVEPLRGSAIEQMHWVNAKDPEECVWGFIDSVSMLGQAAAFCMPTWRDFLWTREQTTAFEHYRQVVQLLISRHPIEPGGFLVLKAPQIALHIADFAEVFPEARFVITDRDPFRALVSLAVMGASIIEPFCVENPILKHEVDLLGTVERKLAALQDFTDARPSRTHHVSYPALVADSARVVTELSERLGLVNDSLLARRVEDFLAAQRAGHRVAPPSSLDTLGYDHDQVLARHAIARYCRRFRIAPEQQRITGSGTTP